MAASRLKATQHINCDSETQEQKTTIMDIWLTILGMALVTFFTRIIAFLVLRGEIAPWLQQWLNFVPVAVFTALIIPTLLIAEQNGARMLAFGPAVPAGVAGAIAAWRTKSVIVT